MAIWQLSFNIIKDVKQFHYKEIDDNNIDETLLWNENVSNLKSLNSLELLLPIEKSWSNSITQYGKIDETCIEIFHNSENSFELSCRLDIRSISEETIKVIINFIKDNNAIIMLNNNFYNPTMGDMKKIIINSKAYKFCLDPTEFFENFERN